MLEYAQDEELRRLLDGLDEALAAAEEVARHPRWNGQVGISADFCCRRLRAVREAVEAVYNEDEDYRAPSWAGYSTPLVDLEPVEEALSDGDLDTAYDLVVEAAEDVLEDAQEYHDRLAEHYCQDYEPEDPDEDDSPCVYRWDCPGAKYCEYAFEPEKVE